MKDQERSNPPRTAHAQDWRRILRAKWGWICVTSPAECDKGWMVRCGNQHFWIRWSCWWQETMGLANCAMLVFEVDVWLPRFWRQKATLVTIHRDCQTVAEGGRIRTLEGVLIQCVLSNHLEGFLIDCQRVETGAPVQPPPTRVTSLGGLTRSDHGAWRQ